MLVKYTLLFVFLIMVSAYEEAPVERAFEVYTQDSIRIEVNLRYNDQQPEYYTCHVKTPVCKEGLCYLVTIDLYWDLLGNFMKYELPPDQPLTKFDHEEFTKADYDKLNRILADKHSLLGDYRMEDLVDESTERVSEEVDAVTGATRKSVQQAVVEGAVYSTYTLWYLANGEIAERIPNYTDSLFDEALLKTFLRSGNHHYPYYALDRLSGDQYATYMPEIMALLDTGSVFVARYALKKIPDKIYADAQWQLALVRQFEQADYATQDLLLQQLTSVALRPESLDVLSQQLDKLSEQQLQAMRLLLVNNQASLSEKTIDRVVQLANHTNPIYAQQGYQTLQQLSPSNQQAKAALKTYKTTHAN